jgi:Holliday junction resolvase
MSAPGREPLPDVFATKGDTLLAFKVKTQNSERAYFRKKQIGKIVHFPRHVQAETSHHGWKVSL